MPTTFKTDPNYYGTQGFQPADYIWKNGLNFFEGNVIKYVTRHREKGKADDIKKAIRYLEFILELEYPEEKKPVKIDGEEYPSHRR